MTTHKVNVHDIKNGQIIIYQRSDHKSGTWQVQLSIPGQKGCVIRSLGTKDLEQAKRFANDQWEDLRAKVKAGGTLLSKSYQDAAAEYVKDLERRGSKTAKTVSDRLVSYSVRFFGKKPIDQIGTKELVAYSEWRLKNGLKKAPCANTLKAERSAMLGVFKWAKDHSFLGVIPDITKPKGKDNRRPDFSRAEITALQNAMPAFITEFKNGLTQRNRTLLCRYVRFMLHSGVRVGEARNLTWRHVEQRTDKGTTTTVLRVSGKTGERDTIPQHAAISGLGERAPEPVVELVPAVPVRRSVTPDYLVCLEDGKKLKMLKRHLRTSYNMSPDEYRAKWGLPSDYPMTAPNYAAKRKELAHRIGLGRKPGPDVAVGE